MSWTFSKSLIAAILLMPAVALGQAATQRGDSSIPLAEAAASADVAPVAGPVIGAAADVGPGTATMPGAAVQPAVAGATAAPLATPAAKPPEIYRGAIEKMPIRQTEAEGAGAPAQRDPPSQALKTGLSQSGIGTAIQVGASLLVVVGLIFIARAMARKWVPGAGASNGKNVIEILARYPLAKAQSLVMVRIGSQIVVLNQTKEASASVLVISDQAEVASILGQVQGGKPTSIQAGFTKLLANAQMDLERREMPEPDAIEARMQANSTMEEEQLDEQLDEMAAAKRQLMELRTQVRTIRENLK